MLPVRENFFEIFVKEFFLEFTNGVKVPPQGKLHELVTQDDTYQRPMLKNASGTSLPTNNNQTPKQPQTQAQQQPVNNNNSQAPSGNNYQYQQNPGGQISAMPSKR